MYRVIILSLAATAVLGGLLLGGTGIAAADVINTQGPGHNSSNPYPCGGFSDGLLLNLQIPCTTADGKELSIFDQGDGTELAG